MTESSKGTKRPAKKKEDGFTADERAAMRERAAEMKRAGSKAEGEADVLAKIAEMGAEDRKIAEAIHAIVKKAAPDLEARTWYGMPAYARDGKVVVFFQPSGKFKARYSTLGFSDQARLDDGNVWPNSYAVTRLTKADEARIATLVEQAAG